MKTLSLCMIVKNEEKTLARALENAHIYADEIIVVDTGSKDSTKKIAQKFTTKVYDYKWKDDFACARNYSFDKAQSRYIIWLDGDDFLPDSTAEKIKEWKFERGEEDVLMCTYATAYDENLKPTYQFLRERIVKNIPLLRWHDRVHEVIVPCGKVVNRHDIVIYHGKQKPHTNRNLKIYQAMIKEGEEFSPRSLFYYARELYYNGHFKKAIHTLKDFLKKEDAFVENKIEACLILCYCYENVHDNEKALDSLLESFRFSYPRGEVLYNIGRIFMNEKKFKQASYWFEKAIENGNELESGAFVDKLKTTLFPALDLVVCYYNLGDLNRAQHFHEVTKGLSPNDESVLHNEQFFASLCKNKI